MSQNPFKRLWHIISNPSQAIEKLSFEAVDINEMIIFVLLLGSLRAAGGIIGHGLLSQGAPFSRVFLSELFGLIGIIALLLLLSYIAKRILKLSQLNSNLARTTKLFAYALAPILACGILRIIPILAWFQFLGLLFGIYVLWIGIPVILNVQPKEKQRVFLYFSALLMLSFGLIGALQMVIRGGFG